LPRFFRHLKKICSWSFSDQDISRYNIIIYLLCTKLKWCLKTNVKIKELGMFLNDKANIHTEREWEMYLGTHIFGLHPQIPTPPRGACCQHPPNTVNRWNASRSKMKRQPTLSLLWCPVLFLFLSLSSSTFYIHRLLLIHYLPLGVDFSLYLSLSFFIFVDYYFFYIFLFIHCYLPLFSYKPITSSLSYLLFLFLFSLSSYLFFLPCVRQLVKPIIIVAISFLELWEIAVR